MRNMSIDGTGTRYYPKTKVTSGEYLYAITKEGARNDCC